MVEDLDALGPQVHLDSLVQLRKGIAFEVVVFQQGNLAGPLVDFDDVGLLDISAQHLGASDIDAQHGVEVLEQARVYEEGLMVEEAERGLIAKPFNDFGSPGRKKQFLSLLLCPFVAS